MIAQVKIRVILHHEFGGHMHVFIMMVFPPRRHTICWRLCVTNALNSFAQNVVLP